MRPILILITVLVTALTSVQATPTISWTVVDDVSGTPITAVKAGLFIIDHLVDTAACTFVGIMFQKACKNLFTPKNNQ